MGLSRDRNPLRNLVKPGLRRHYVRLRDPPGPDSGAALGVDLDFVLGYKDNSGEWASERIVLGPS